jgi:hypothetical protein
MKFPRIKAKITFYPASEGGRHAPPVDLSDGKYRPHLVVGDPNQLRALVMDGATKETYLGVAFVGGPSEIIGGESFLADLALAYWPNITYEELVPGATFTVREGPNVVGYGRVESVDGAT